MPLHDFKIGIMRNPLIHSPFSQDFNEQESAPPPGDNFWVESLSGNQMITPEGNKYVFKTE